MLGITNGIESSHKRNIKYTIYKGWFQYALLWVFGLIVIREVYKEDGLLCDACT